MIKRALLIYCLAAGSALASAISLSSLRCEYRDDPIGIDIVQPRLSWIIESETRGVTQTAFQVLAASSPELLKANQGDLWDSGKVASDQSIQVVYTGKVPASGQGCWWKVRVWDQVGIVSAWSKPATWTMGLLKPEDWKASWIGYAAPEALAMEQQLVLEGAHWIWANGSTNGDAPAGDVFFRKVIEVPANESVRQALFLLTADDTLRLFVNGEAVGSEHLDWHQLAVRDLTRELKPGRNVIAVRARNLGGNPAGFVGRLVVVLAGGQSNSVSTDSSWLSVPGSAGAPPTGWNKVEFNDADWRPAGEVAAYGDQPWGKIPRYLSGPAPFFRKAFNVDKRVRRATAFASALGVYELRLNGKAVDTDALSPGWTDYRKRVHYIGYDVTAQLKRGENVLGAILGDGWFASYLAFTHRRNYYGIEPRLIVQLQIDYQDGTREIVGTDKTWKAAIGPIREADLLMGCVYDARAEFNGWDRRGFDDRTWTPAQADGAVEANLLAHPAPPIRRIEDLAAKSVTEPKPGVYVFDLGQNIVGWARIKMKGSAGQRVVVRHAEVLNPNGTIYTDNLRSAKATDTFYLAGGSGREYEPSFTFHGFRYVEVSGLNYKPAAGDVTGVVVHSDLARAGWFECSEPLINKLALNSLWGQRGNFLDVPTDCPQRDERAGWTGDAQVFMKTACFNMDSPAFYTKWLADLCEDSQRNNGAFYDVAPSLNVVRSGNTGWSDAGPICAWRMFEMYADSRALSRHYPALVRHMDFLANTSTNFVRGAGAHGDWLRLTGPQKSEAMATAYYFYTTQVMVAIADALDNKPDAKKFRELAENIRATFVANYLKPDGRIVDGNDETGQTLYALAFGLDLVPADMKRKVAEQFVELLHREDDHIGTGFLGTPFLLFALQKAGHPELAYKLVLNKTYPSWLQQVLWGSTTMWERWDGWRPEKGFQSPGMNSFNHYWLGCVNEWLFTQAAGIDTDGPGFKRIVIRPELVKPGSGFDWVNASYHSIRGPIASSWKRDGGRFRLNVDVPGNCTATVYVPARALSDVTESGVPAGSATTVKFLRVEEGRAVFEVGSGRYAFVSRAGYPGNP